MSQSETSDQTGNRFVEGAGGSALGVLLIQACELITDQTYRDLAISSVPIISVLSGFLIHFCYQYVATDWHLVRMNRNFDKSEKRLRRQLKNNSISQEERDVINEQLVLLQKLRMESEISRIKKTIDEAPDPST